MFYADQQSAPTTRKSTPFSSPRQRSALLGILAAVFFLVQLAQGQTASPRFDVVAIHPVDPNGPLIMVDPTVSSVSLGQYTNPAASLTQLISFAYSIKTPDLNLENLPKWARGLSFSVSAKSDPIENQSPAENHERVRQMMRHLLADRFALRIHPEERPATILRLEVAKRGLQVEEAAAPVPPEKEGFVNMALGDRGGRMVGRKSTFDGLATALSIFFKQPVVNGTGLKGYYDFDVKWTADLSTNPAPSLGPDGLALLITTLDDRLGLALKKAPGKMQVWVVDNVQMPSAN